MKIIYSIEIESEHNKDKNQYTFKIGLSSIGLSSDQGNIENIDVTDKGFLSTGLNLFAAYIKDHFFGELYKEKKFADLSVENTLEEMLKGETIIDLSPSEAKKTKKIIKKIIKREERRKRGKRN